MDKNDKNKWVKEVLDSYKGATRAKPSPDLFDKIITEIEAEKTRVIPLYLKRIASIAAVFLLIVNISVIRNYNSSANNFAMEDKSSTDVYSSVILEYNFNE